MTTQVNNHRHTSAVEEKSGRRCYAYIIAVSGRLWSLCAFEWWGTPEQMREDAASMATAARIFRHSASVAVYELHTDDNFHYVHGCQMPASAQVPATFHRYDCPVIRRQNAN